MQTAFFSAGETLHEERDDSFTDLDTIGEIPTSRGPMYITVTLLVAVVIGGMVYFYQQSGDGSRDIEAALQSGLDSGSSTASRAARRDARAESTDNAAISTSNGDASSGQGVDQVASGDATPAADDASMAAPDTQEQIADASPPSAPDAAVSATDDPVTPTAEPDAAAVAPPTSEPTREQQREARRMANRAVNIAERQPDEALALARQASEIDPSQAMPWFVIGYVQKQQGNASAARRALEQCVESGGAGVSDCRLLLRQLGE